MEYNFSKLWEAQFFGFYEFKEFYQYASDKEAQINYYKRLKAVYVSENGEYEAEMSQSMIDFRIEANASALKMITNQLIVFLFTRYEFVIQDAIKCLFCDNPERLLKLIKIYPDYRDAIGFSLVEFVKYESKEKYVTILSERLSSKILSGKPSNTIKRLRCLLDFEAINTAILDELMDKPFKVTDSSIANRASIVFTFEYNSQNLLFCGDALPECIPKGEFELVKLPHHGSIKNISEEMLSGIQTHEFLICADGSAHPDKQTVAKLLQRYGKITVMSNYPWWNYNFLVKEDSKYIQSGKLMFKLVDM